MFGIHTNTHLLIGKSFMHHPFQMRETDGIALIGKNILQTAQLHLIRGADKNLITSLLFHLQSIRQQLELLIYHRLRVTFHIHRFSPEIHIWAPFHHTAPVYVFKQLRFIR